MFSKNIHVQRRTKNSSNQTQNLQISDSSSVIGVKNCHSIIFCLQQADLFFDETFRDVPIKHRIGLHLQHHGKMTETDEIKTRWNKNCKYSTENSKTLLLGIWLHITHLYLLIFCNLNRNTVLDFNRGPTSTVFWCEYFWTRKAGPKKPL